MAVIAGQRILLPLTSRRGVIATKHATRRAQLALVGLVRGGTEQVLRIPGPHRHRIVRDLVPICVAVVALQPERIILPLPAGDNSS